MIKTELVIVEGPDCAGKSTYIKNNFNKYEVLKATQSTTYRDYSQWLANILPGDLYVMDRCWESDVIYSWLKHMLPNLTAHDRYKLNLEMFALEQMGVKIRKILLLPSLETVLSRYDKRGDDYITREELIIVWHKYNAFKFDKTWELINSNE